MYNKVLHDWLYKKTKHKIGVALFTLFALQNSSEGETETTILAKGF